MAIADALKGNFSLANMSFQGNNIDNEGVIAIADALKVNCTITWISKCANQNVCCVVRLMAKEHNFISFEWIV